MCKATKTINILKEENEGIEEETNMIKEEAFLGRLQFKRNDYDKNHMCNAYVCT